MTERLFRRAMRFLSDPRGGVSSLLALMMIPLIGVFGMGAEASSWYLIQRAAQNAADSSAMAAASNGCDPDLTPACTGVSYKAEAAAVATNLGFTGDAATTVTPSRVTCPGGATADCYRVTITRQIPIYLVRVVGFNGDATLADGSRAQTVTATAIVSSPIPANYCMVALAHGLAAGTEAFTINGGPGANFGGCDIYSNASTKCTGGGGSTIGVATTVDPNPKLSQVCGGSQIKAASPYVDTHYSSLAIPTGCTVITSPTATSGNVTLNPLKASCVSINADFKINANVTATMSTANPGTVLVIQGGHNLVLNAAASLKAAVGSGLTIVFTGTSGAPGFVTGATGSKLDFGAPQSGTWSGVALYQDPALTTVSAVTYSGSSPTFNITGTIYAPYMNFTINGAINKQTGGYTCIGIIANKIQSNGTGDIFSTDPTSECHKAGASLPNVPGTVAVRQVLVQ